MWCICHEFTIAELVPVCYYVCNERRVRNMKILFVIYAGLIPIVPLIGFEIYRAKKNKKKAAICAGLFAMQVLISTVSIITYL